MCRSTYIWLTGSIALVDGDEIREGGIDAHDAGVEIHSLCAAAMLHALIVARALDENAAHRERRGGEEMTAAVPLLLAACARDAQIRFVHERRRLQRLVVMALAGEARPREFPQFVIDFGQHFARRAGAAVTVGVRRHRTREL